MNARHFPSLLLAATIGTVLLLEPFAQNSMPSSSPILIEANRTPFKVIPDTGADDDFDDDFKEMINVLDPGSDDIFDDDFKDLRNVIKPPVR